MNEPGSKGRRCCNHVQIMETTSNTINMGQFKMNRGLYAYYTLFAGILLVLISVGSGCNVEIEKPYHPMYVQTGRSLKLVCTARNCKPGERVKLQWWRQTESSSWGKEKITPKSGGRWITRDLYEEPSGDVQSTLLLENVSVADHGWYICRDERDVNTYTIWVTTLQVDATPNVTVTGSDRSDVTLACTVSGPNTNLPRIDYEWTWNKLRVINISERYTLYPPRIGTQRLQIHKPKKGDGGMYTCSFVFGTNLGPQIFSKSIYVDTTQLEVSHGSHPLLYHPLLGAALLLTAVNHWL